MFTDDGAAARMMRCHAATIPQPAPAWKPQGIRMEEKQGRHDDGPPRLVGTVTPAGGDAHPTTC